MARVADRHSLLNYSPNRFRFFDVYGSSRSPVACRKPNRPATTAASVRGTSPPIVLNETAVRELGFKSPQDAIGRSVNWHFNPDANMANQGLTDPADGRRK